MRRGLRWRFFFVFWNILSFFFSDFNGEEEEDVSYSANVYYHHQLRNDRVLTSAILNRDTFVFCVCIFRKMRYQSHFLN